MNSTTVPTVLVTATTPFENSATEKDMTTPTSSFGDKARTKILNFLSTCSGEEILHILSKIPKLQELDIVAGITEYKRSLKADVRTYLLSQSQRAQRMTLTQQLINRYGEIIIELRPKMSADKLAQYLEAYEQQTSRPKARLEKITPAMIRAAIIKLQEPAKNILEYESL